MSQIYISQPPPPHFSHFSKHHLSTCSPLPLPPFKPFISQPPTPHFSNSHLSTPPLHRYHFFSKSSVSLFFSSPLFPKISNFYLSTPSSSPLSLNFQLPTFPISQPPRSPSLPLLRPLSLNPYSPTSLKPLFLNPHSPTSSASPISQTPICQPPFPHPSTSPTSQTLVSQPLFPHLSQTLVSQLPFPCPSISFTFQTPIFQPPPPHLFHFSKPYLSTPTTYLSHFSKAHLSNTAPLSLSLLKALSLNPRHLTSFNFQTLISQSLTFQPTCFITLSLNPCPLTSFNFQTPSSQSFTFQTTYFITLSFLYLKPLTSALSPLLPPNTLIL